ncbi:hypothetical protein K438DRAFT_1988199 [Mycena galopus ATCC 62051]|nr:hypothetical protein K438DRAFT_1988199 [Mycena galopus ATCC 62051]
MTVEEMIPDTLNPAHDPRFWCLPPVRDEPSEHRHEGYRMYLVSQGRAVGVWYNWTLVKAMVSGYPSGAQRGHNTMEGCVAEWQQHCVLGVHPHPPRPSTTDPVPAPIAQPSTQSAQPVISPTKLRGTPGTPKSRGRVAKPELQAQLYCLPDLSTLSLSPKDDDDTSVSSVSSLNATSWDDVPEVARYFALWGGRIVYTDRGYARLAFLRAEAEGSKPRILSTANYDEAQAFSESVYWL